MARLTLLILAAGMGSRYGGLKQLDEVGPSGETIIDYSIHDAIDAGFGEVIFVVRKYFRADFEDRVYKRYGNAVAFNFVEQELNHIPEQIEINPEREKPWGTGHAMLVAESMIGGSFAVINADDYYGQRSFHILADYLRNLEGRTGEYVTVGFLAGNTLSESGGVSRGICAVDKEGFLLSVEEHHKIREVGNVIEGENGVGEKVYIGADTPVSMNMWGFTPDILKKGKRLFSTFLREKGGELKSEFYIPSLVNDILLSHKGRCRLLETPDHWFGVTYKEDRDMVAKKIAEMVAKGIYPSPLFPHIM